MRRPSLLCAGILLLPLQVALAAKVKRPPAAQEATSTNTLILPEGVRNIPNYGLCRERAPDGSPQLQSVAPVTVAPVQPAPVRERERPSLEPRSTTVVVAPPRHVRGKGTVTGTVTLAGGKDPANTVIAIEGVPGGRPAPGKNHPQIFQRDLAFVPALNVVTVGTSIDFPNEDHVFHNIFSVSEPAKFDLGLYKAGESRSVTFTRPGVVDVYCNIHPQMISEIKVVDTRYYAVTGKDGTFRIEDVPEGKYRITAWHSNSAEASEEVEVKANATAEHPFTLSVEGANPNHLRKDGTPYGRYK